MCKIFTDIITLTLSETTPMKATHSKDFTSLSTYEFLYYLFLHFSFWKHNLLELNLREIPLINAMHNNSFILLSIYTIYIAIYIRKIFKYHAD